jgi:predicted GNAT family N-acyltransferase
MVEAALLDFETTREFDWEMDQLRVLGFPAEQWDTSARDAYDSVSLHVLARCDAELAAYLRFTPASQGYYRSKFGEQGALPLSAVTADFSRCVVAPKHRGHSLFEAIMLEGLSLATDAGYSYAVGTCVPWTGAHRLLNRLGLEDIGSPIAVVFNRLEISLQALCADVSLRSGDWFCQRRKAALRLREAGYTVRSVISACNDAFRCR